jgi:hypothetical protein
MLDQPTSQPFGIPIDIPYLNDPLVRKLVLGAAALIALLIVFRLIGHWRERAAVARRRAELRRACDDLRLQQEEIKKLAEQIVATSSTGRIAGYAIVRQVETIFTEPKASSVAVVELVKAVAAQKGANALINLHSQQMPGGKWVASGDAVIVRQIGKLTGDK